MSYQKQGKGWLTVLKESMVKTGGCCGPGESCCDGKPQSEVKKDSAKPKA